MRTAVRCARIVLAAAALAVSANTPDASAAGMSGPQTPESGPARRQLWHIPAAHPSVMMRAHVFRPKGAGPFPLVVINHGSSQNPERRQLAAIPDFALAAHWFVERGFAVVVPQRPGHGETGGPYLEDQGGCEDADFLAAGIRTADSIRAAMRFMLGQPFVQKSGVVVVGQSAGGWGALALARHNPPEVRAVVNVSGGRGGRAYNRDNNNCAPARLEATAAEYGRGARVPTLWLYGQGDRFFGPDLARRLAAAFASGGGKAEFHLLPDFGAQGHDLLGSRDALPVWGPIVARFLGKAR